MASKKKTSADMQVTLVKVEDIKKAEYNPRAISTSAMNGLKASIKKFGLTAPLVVNTRTGNLVSGHQRLEAATQLGFTEVPVVHVDYSEQEEKALNITLNNSAITGYFTDELQTILSEIKFDLNTDFEELKLDSLEIKTSWDTDLDSSHFDDDDGTSKDVNFSLNSTIKVRCKPEYKQQIVELLKEFVKISQDEFGEIRID
jgi:hypothetical protein